MAFQELYHTIPSVSITMTLLAEEKDERTCRRISESYCVTLVIDGLDRGACQQY